ncbi:MAG: hypothetical protein CVU56_25285 [Deltaproteobacteria bacterium HGW-Deltaproteobacteria-14]|jgi:hypothetical protein|nr:MAG: hypothetical protein CVU56_25285 [Deltaproteobacteria bacterium HGW-Deltaproteobacteria-14]
MMVRGLLVTCAVASLGGCISNSRSSAVDGVDTGAVSPDVAGGDTADDAGGGDTGPPGGVAVAWFKSDFAVITRGDDRLGQPVAGTVTLSWRTQGAAAVVLEAAGVPVALDGCVATGAGPCAEAGRITVTPTEPRTFTLRAVGPGGRCGDAACPERSLEIGVKPPAIIGFTVAQPVSPAGADLRVPYTVDAPTWAIGRLDEGPNGIPQLAPCVPADEATAASPCRIEADGGRPLDEAGVAVFPALDRSVVVAATASNGADDGLGDVHVRDLATPVTVPIEIRRLELTPPQVLPGGTVRVSWEVVGAQSVAVTADPPILTGLATCVGLGADGAGFCTVTVAEDGGLGPVDVTLVARQAEGLVGKATADLAVIAGPTIARFEATPASAAPGQQVTLAWSAYGADAVALDAAPAGALEGLDACAELSPDGVGGCTVTVAAGASVAPITATLTATHQTVGPGAEAALTVTLVPAPVVVEALVTDDTVEVGGEVVLSWAADNAVAIGVSEASGVIPAAALAGCGGLDASGLGGCTLTVPASAEPGELTLAVTATGATGAQSQPRAVTVAVGRRPQAALTAAPVVLPEAGGDATLTWSAPGATRAVIATDDGEIIVDTAAGELCDGGAACAPAGDALTVATTRSTTWTLTASNAFGERLATALARLEGAPHIDALTLDGADALGGPKLALSGTEAIVAWTVGDVQISDALNLERAPLPTPNGSCDAVSAGAWESVAGFPRAGADAGQTTVAGLDATATCLRFTAQDQDATPGQRDLAVFEVYQPPTVTALSSADDTVAVGERITLIWTTSDAYGVTVSVSPVGTVTAQELAGCAAASGSCALQVQAGTPLGEVTFSLVAEGEANALSASATTAVTIGVAPSVASFQVNPASAAAAVDATLSWTTHDGGHLTITEGATELLATSEHGAVAAGSHTVAAVSATRTWRLTVSNPFGEATAQTTTFIGPSIDALSVAGKSALGGEVTVPTGPATVAWSTTSADGDHTLDAGPVPSGGSCATAAFATVFEDDAPQDSGSFGLGVVTNNRCVRLRVANSETPPQTNQATFLLREVPVITAATVSPASLGSGGGVVIVDMKLRGVSALSVTAAYLGSDGGVLGTRDVCDESSLNSGSVSNGAEERAAQCTHGVTPCSFLCLNQGMPAATKRIRYSLTVRDGEGDAASYATDAASDVQVN